MAGRAPNVFQMLLFMYSADVVLVDVPFGKVANYVLGQLNLFHNYLRISE